MFSRLLAAHVHVLYWQMAQTNLRSVFKKWTPEFTTSFMNRVPVNKASKHYWRSYDEAHHTYIRVIGYWLFPLQWRHYERDGVSNHQPCDCLLNRLFNVQIKENIKAPRHWPLWGEFTGNRWITHKRASNAENVSIWWRHHDCRFVDPLKSNYIYSFTKATAASLFMLWCHVGALGVILNIPCFAIASGIYTYLNNIFALWRILEVEVPLWMLMN